ncbi:SDR family NAD(P)-dependent oxidoreductase [Paraburkholderia sp. DHOC27]|uniref:SDR family NAD(P)-dependent oxidoreductase n=1 Tax=Paraburkholderia sp. DHOC27 TaxID=2303330 RepID=UPI001C708B12|nr:SDR family oxidoreductase [Paraburkholderia sp. DHOC27]
MDQEFANKLAFVMGGGSGIGLAAARLMAARGAAVAIFSDREDSIEAARRIGEETGARALGFVGDGAQAADVERAIHATAAAWGGLDIIVNSAAIHPYGDALSTDEATWDRTLQVNLKSMYLTAHTGIGFMIERGGGAIVNVASNQGSACSRNLSAYATSKGAILAFTRTLAMDFGARGIRANSVSPGPIATPMLQRAAELFGDGKTLDETYRDWGKRVPLQRIGQPEELAEVVAFLAGPRSSYCTGADFVADGGLLANLGF